MPFSHLINNDFLTTRKNEAIGVEVTMMQAFGREGVLQS
jgi:hypothetical protein